MGQRIMKGTVEYEGYRAPFEWNDEDAMYCGNVEDTAGIICYEGKTIAQVCKFIREAIDSHLKICETRGMTPRQPMTATKDPVSA
jgi:predicted HicB family RNase H-like nuclease